MAKKSDEKKKDLKNLFKRGDSWVLDFRYRGQRYVEVLGPVSLTVARETRDKRRGAAAAGELDFRPKAEDPLFETAMERYLGWYETNRAAYTFQKYATPASKALKDSFDGKRLSQISPFNIEAHKTRRKTDVTPTTINHDLTFLRHFFTKAVEWKLVDVSPVTSGMFFKLKDGRTRYLTEEEATNLLAACTPDLRVLVLAAMHTGFRRKELTSLCWSSVNLAQGTVEALSAYTKNGEARMVPLSPDLAAALRTMKEQRKPKPEDFIFTIEGRQWKAWRRSFNSAKKRAKIENFRWHDLRHCFGSWLAMNDVSDTARMELMGHKDHAMTRRYSHLSPGYKSKAIAKLPQFGKSVMESQQISQQEETAAVVAFPAS